MKIPFGSWWQHGLDCSCQVVISSPLSRAIETSLLIFGESMPPARFFGECLLVGRINKVGKNEVQGKHIASTLQCVLLKNLRGCWMAPLGGSRYVYIFNYMRIHLEPFFPYKIAFPFFSFAACFFGGTWQHPHLLLTDIVLWNAPSSWVFLQSRWSSQRFLLHFLPSCK